MTRYITSPIVAFGSTTFTGTNIKSAILVEQFDPLSATLPIGTLQLILYSDDPAFSMVEPTGDYLLLKNRQPLAVYEEANGGQVLIGQFYLDTWKNVSEKLIQLDCVDLIGLLDTITYDGGIWLNSISVGDLLSSMLNAIGVAFVLDPDLYGFQISGWLPICTYREALQQIAFASGACITGARQGEFLKISKTYLSGAISDGIPSGIARTGGQTRIYQQRFRSQSWSAGYPSQRSGFGRTGGQTKIYQRRWRPGTWGELLSDIVISKAEKGMEQSLELRPQITSIELVAHNMSIGTGTLKLFDGILPVGATKITFKQPMHDLVVTGAGITDSSANYVIVSVGAAGPVLVSGQVYTDTQQPFTLYPGDQTLPPGTKPNIIKVSSASLVNSTNAADIIQRIYLYYQQRYLQKVKLYSPVAAVGNVVVIDTLYDKKIRGVVEKMTSDLANGFTAQADIIGIVT